jgi:hypothetical protein
MVVFVIKCTTTWLGILCSNNDGRFYELRVLIAKSQENERHDG